MDVHLSAEAEEALEAKDRRRVCTTSRMMAYPRRHFPGQSYQFSLIRTVVLHASEVAGKNHDILVEVLVYDLRSKNLFFVPILGVVHAVRHREHVPEGACVLLLTVIQGSENLDEGLDLELRQLSH